MKEAETAAASLARDLESAQQHVAALEAAEKRTTEESKVNSKRVASTLMLVNDLKVILLWLLQ